MRQGHLTRCTVNPALGEPDECRLDRTEHPQRVVVVGSGPAGMEAAVTAAARGHRVTLCEKDSEVGGNLRLGSIPFFKEDLRRYFDYIRRRLERSGVQVVLNREGDGEFLKKLAPDVVVVATGAEMTPLNVPGGEKALPVVSLLANRASLGKRVLIIGAGFVGCEVGWHLAHEGRQVQLIDLLPEAELLAQEHYVNRATLFDQLNRARVSLLCNASPKEITERGVMITLADGQERLLAADSVISCIGFRPRRKLYQELLREENGWEIYPVGDCVKVENLHHAIQAAHQLARNL
jgi:NADPH-dependent 2,4-dienoyl-CoA reductase/sulfur reductase-like enzyme